MLKRLAVLLAPLSLAAGADPIRYALVLHGGAGADPKLMSPEEKRATEKGLETALRLGLNMLKEGKPSLDVLSLIPGVEVRESRARCCGIAGTYGYKVEKYQIGMDVGAELFDFVAAQGPVSLTACDSETCRWQLEHGTTIPSRHPIEVLAAAYGLYDLGGRRLVKRQDTD